MKRLLSLCLFLAIALCCFSAVADAPVISDAQLTNEDHWNAPYDHTVWKRILTFELNTDAVLTAVIMDADSGEVFSDTRISNNGPVANQLPVSAGTISLYWPAVNAEGWHPDEGVMGNYTIDITVENDDGSDNMTIARSLIFSHSITDHVQAGYLHNNIRSFGPRFCDVAPEITDKWFRFTPVDLSVNGEQTFDLISGDYFLVGTVTVTVNGDSVRVDYKYNSTEIWDWKDVCYYTFFADLDSVGSVEAKDIQNRYSYGVEYSIANDLKGDTSVLLYLCNRATHTDDLSKLTAFRANDPAYRRQLEAMMEILGLPLGD